MADDTSAPAAPQTETATPAATTETAPQTATETTTATTEAAPAAEAKPEGTEAETPKRTPWFQARIDQLTKEKWDLKRQNDTMAAALATKPAATGTAPAPAATGSEADVERRATEIAAAREFNSASDKVYQAGKEAFADFDTAIGNFKMLGGLPMPFLQAVVDIPDAHKILHRLGGNLDEAQRVMSLPPARMGFELARLAADTAEKPRPVSGAPAPIKPLGGTAKAEPDLETMPIKDWVAWREKNRRQRR